MLMYQASLEISGPTVGATMIDGTAGRRVRCGTLRQHQKYEFGAFRNFSYR